MTAQEAEPWKPLCWTDPEQFMENLLKDDEARVHTYTTAQDILFGEIMRYGGSFNHPEWMVPLRHLYDEFVNHGMAREQRWEVLSYVAILVENSKAFTVNAFLPFICQDPHRHIVAKAAVDYVSLGPLLNDDPMFFPKELIGLILPQGTDWTDRRRRDSQPRRCVRCATCARRPAPLQIAVATQRSAVL